MTLIALTGYGQQEDIQRSRTAGFDAHIIKPVDFNYLARLIAENAGRSGQVADLLYRHELQRRPTSHVDSPAASASLDVSLYMHLECFKLWCQESRC